MLSRDQLRLYDSSRQLVQVLQKALEGLASLSPRPGGNAGRRGSSGTGDAVVAQAKSLVTATGAAPHFSEQGRLAVTTGCYAHCRLVGWLWTGLCCTSASASWVGCERRLCLISAIFRLLEWEWNMCLPLLP